MTYNNRLLNDGAKLKGALDKKVDLLNLKEECLEAQMLAVSHGKNLLICQQHWGDLRELF